MRKQPNKTFSQFERWNRYFIVLVFILSINLAKAQDWRAGIHDPSSIVKCKNKYWVFGTGDGIYARYSTDLVTWTDGPSPFTKTDFPVWINSYVGGTTNSQGQKIFHGSFWAPDIIYMNNKYYLYYSCSEWGTMTSTIGCVVNKTLDPNDPEFKWEDAGFLGIWSYQAGLALNAIDPSISRGNDGKIWMVYGSFNERGIVVTELDSITGKPKTYANNLPGITIANSWTGPNSNNYGEGEGAFMKYHDGYYYLFYNKGGCCAGIASTYYIVVGRSTSPKGPFFDKTGTAMVKPHTKSGGSVVFKHDNKRGLDDRYYGPGHLGVFTENGIDYASFHYYDPNWYYPNEAANYKGGPTLGLAKLKWGEDGWPSISMDFLEKGIYTLKNANSNKMMDLQSHISTNGKFLYQYTQNSTYDTQKWLFTPLGTGEYNIRSYADTTKYVEASGSNNEDYLRVTNNYKGAINQKFRLVQSPNGKVIIYPSISDKLFEIPNAYTSDSQIKLWGNTNHNCQRWNVTQIIESLSTSLSNLQFSCRDTVITDLSVTSNVSWTVFVDDESWLTVTPNKGTGNQILTITTTANNNLAERTNRIIVKTQGGKTLTININQDGNPTSAVEKHQQLNVSVYPNPTDGLIHLKYQRASNLTMYNNTGTQLMSVKLTENETTLDLSNMISGLYFLKISNDKMTFIQKVMKK